MSVLSIANTSVRLAQILRPRWLSSSFVATLSCESSLGVCFHGDRMLRKGFELVVVVQAVSRQYRTCLRMSWFLFAKNPFFASLHIPWFISVSLYVLWEIIPYWADWSALSILSKSISDHNQSFYRVRFRNLVTFPRTTCNKNSLS